MKRFYLSIILVAALAIPTLGTQKAVAQEILLEGPLAGAPAVRNLVQYRKLRVSLGPQFAFTLLNDYTHNFLLGGRVEFNINEWLAVGAVAYGVFTTTTNLTDHIADSENVGAGETTPSESNFPSYTGANNFTDQVARMKGMYLGQISLIPLRGKMSLFDRLFVAIDGSIFVGGGVVQYDQRKNCSGIDTNTDPDIFESDCGTLDNPIVERETRIKPAFTWGLGAMVHFGKWFAVNVEYRMTPFKWNPGGTDEAGEAASEWKLQPNTDPATGDVIDGEFQWSPESTGTSGAYPNGEIGNEDMRWYLNQSIAIGFIFYFPFEPSIAD